MTSSVAALTVAGLLSGLLSVFLPFSVFGDLDFSLRPSVLFGSVLAGYLWFTGMRSLWRVCALLAASFAAYSLALGAAGSPFFGLGLLDFLGRAQMVPSPTQMFSAGAIGATVVSAAFLLLVYGEQHPGPRFYLEAVCCGASGGILGLSSGILENPNSSLKLMIIVWQTGMACVLGAIASRQPTLALSPSIPHGRLPASARAFFAVVVAGIVVHEGWLAYASRQAAGWQANVDAAVSKSISEAPSRDLAALVPATKEQVLILRSIAGFEPLRSWDRLDLADTTPGDPGSRHALRPERRVYFVSYRLPVERQGLGFGVVDANVTQYPSPDWAKYELRNTPTFNYAIGLPEDQRPKKVAKHGGYVFSDWLDTYWSSGDRLVRLHAEGVLAAVIDEFAEEYLAKHPSSIDSSFALPAGPRRLMPLWGRDHQR